MRQIGTLSSEADAQRFTDYLTTLGISSQTEPDDGNWIVWVRDEDQLQAAKQQLQDFEAQPNAEKYRDATIQANSIRQEAQKKRAQIKKQTVEMRGNWNQPLSRRAPLVMVLMGLCIFIFFVSGQGQSKDGVAHRTLAWADSNPSTTAQLQDGLSEIRRGQLWRLITPIFLHYGIIHILFNMYWMYFLGGLIEPRRGTWKFGVMVFVIALVSNMAQYFVPLLLSNGTSPWFGGISGVVYGLFGYVWIRTEFANDRYPITQGLIIIMLVFLVLGFSGGLDRTLGASIANWAHLGGLLTGMAIAYLPIALGHEKP